MLQKKDKRKIIFFKESIFKVAEQIFNYPNKTFHIRLLQEKTKFSTTAVISAIKELADYKIVSIEKTSITTNIRANLGAESYIFYKRLFNLYRLERYGLIHTLQNVFQAKTIVLFGSFAKGEDIEESDIDLLILSNAKTNKIPEKLIRIHEKELNRNINMHILNSLEKSEKSFKNAVANGIVLYGYLKVI